MSSKIVWFIAGVVAIAGLLDLKYKGAAYKLLPAAMKAPIDRLFRRES